MSINNRTTAAVIDAVQRGADEYRRYASQRIATCPNIGKGAHALMEWQKDWPHRSEASFVEPRVREALGVLGEVAQERQKQDAKWGEQNHPNGTRPTIPSLNRAEFAKSNCESAFAKGEGTWRHILEEEVAEAFSESDPDRLREELVQVAAVAVAWIEKIDRDQTK